MDVIAFVVDRTAWTPEDANVLAQIQRSGLPTLLVVNKVDLLADKEDLLPHLQMLSGKADFAAILPVSALRQHNVDALEQQILQFLPEL